MIQRAVLVAALCLAPHLASAQDVGTLARDAADQFTRAHTQLEQVSGARDRVRALTGIIRAYEDGLEAMREGLRRVSLREAEITRTLDAERDQVGALLSTLINFGSDASPVALLHPDGPVGNARAAMLVADMTPALQSEVARLRGQLEEIAALRSLQEASITALATGLSDVQSARTDLSQAISERTDLPKRFVAEPDRVQRLVDDAETLAGFADGLAVLDEVGGVAPLADITDAQGTWSLPVEGALLRGYGDADLAGIERPGWLIAARPLSLVTTPWPATVRYFGPLLDYGNVIILEPGNDVLLVLAGVEDVYGRIGDIIPAGTPVGAMGGVPTQLNAFVENARDGTGAGRSETLYIEVRQGGEPVDPGLWFAETGEKE